MATVKFSFARGGERSVGERRESLEFGRTGEQLAARYLVDKGYAIVEHNYRRGHLEIDLIALDGDELVVVEVKSRAHDSLLQPEQAVDHRKRQALIRLANEYVKSHHRTEPVRFDIVAVTSKSGGGAEVNHIKNAFSAMNY